MQNPKLPIDNSIAMSTLIAIPVFNEFGHVHDVLAAVRRFANNILVIDDGSTDGTSALLKGYDFIEVISHKKNIGYGQSLIDAFEFARLNDFKWIITIDCDHQHEPSYIPCFCDKIEKTNADIISGSRYINPIQSSSIPPPKARVAINKKITKILNKALGSKLTDSFCGFKAYKVRSLAGLKLTEAGYGLPLQLLIQASRAGLILREIPVPLIYHDPKRNFAGTLAEPKARFEYYMQVIEQELGTDVYTNTAKTDYS